jgi:protease secretion system membrane fusion protein
MSIQDMIDVFRPGKDHKNKEEQKYLYNDTKSPVKIGILILIIGFGTFLLWSAFAPLDEGVPCSGVVSIDTKRKVVESQHGGTIAAVYVQEGQMVKNGELLVSLDKQAAQARYDEMHQRYLGLRATEARLLAQLSGKGSITFHPDLLTDDNRLLAESQMQTQRQLFVAEQQRMRIFREQLGGIRSMVAEGYAPVNQQRDIELKIAEMNSSAASQLSQVRLEVDADAEKTKAMAKELAATELRAPVAGQVVGLQMQTVGAVVQPGQKIMDIVPLDEKLIIDTKVSPPLIDRIRNGMPVDVSFFSFVNSPHLVVEGRIVSISKDIISDPSEPGRPSASYYLARVAITKKGLKELGKREMQPGMPAQVIVKTGERSLLNYLVNPLFKRIAISMKEE